MCPARRKRPRGERRWGFDETPRGDGGGDGGVGELCTLHWCWERAPVPELRTLRAVSGSSSTDVWAVGDGGLIRRWDGVQWSLVPSPTLDALVRTPNDVTIYVVGSNPGLLRRR